MIPVPGLRHYTQIVDNHVQFRGAPPAMCDAVKRSLTIPIPESQQRPGGPTTIDAWWYVGDVLCAPRFAGLQLADADMTPGLWGDDDNAWPPETVCQMAVHSGVQLRPAQKKAVKLAIRNMNSTGGTCVVLPCGTGKTFIGAAVAKCMGLRCVVLAHQANLLSQWKEAFEAVCPVRLGMIKGRVNVPGDVVLVSTPTLISRGPGILPPNIGLVIVDECHHLPAQATRMAISGIRTRHILGLTATPQRSDKHPVEWYTGPFTQLNVVQSFESPVVMSGPNVMVQRVPLMVYQISTHVGTGNDILDKHERPALPRMLNYLMLSQKRFNLIKQLLQDWSKDHYVMVLSDRKQLLNDLASIFENSGLCTGDNSSEQQREVLESKPRILLCTSGVAREGLDAPIYDTLLCCTPSVRVEQQTGRVQRVREGKTRAVVLDLCDSMTTYQHWAMARKRRYEQLGATVQWCGMSLPSP